MFLLPAAAMSNISTSMISISEEATTCNISSETIPRDHFSLSSLLPPLSSPHHHHHQPQLPPPKPKKKRNQPGYPDPDAEVVAMSPKTLMATNRFVCEICNKGFQRDQNLQLHRRGHNLPWKLRQKSSGAGGKEGAGGGGGPARKRVYVCPEPSCVHHHPSRALGDLTGIKKHFSRKHGEKKWKCERCAKRYAVHSDWKAHVKACGMREYRCDCGTLFSRKDTFITHRAFCDALAEESKQQQLMSPPPRRSLLLPSIPSSNNLDIFNAPISPHLSATALLQKASAMGLLSFSSYGYSAPASVPAGGRGDVIQYLQPTWHGAGSRSTMGFGELLPDLAMGGGTSYAPMAGGPVGKRLAGFPPANGSWS